MNPIIAWLKAVRYVNLLVIVYAMYLMRWCIIIPFLQKHQLETSIPESIFALFVIATVMVSAAGYIINDYFDIKIDRINKPNRIIVGRWVKRRVAMATHVVLNAFAIIISAYAAYLMGMIQLALIHVFCIAALWFYSTEFKYQLFIGNIIIALCLALVPLSVILFEIPSLIDAYKVELLDHPKSIAPFKHVIMSLFYWVLSFSLFAFIMSMAREITKDIEDIKGDEVFHCNTVPIKYGVNVAKWIINLFYGIALVGIIWIQQTFLPDYLSLIYAAVLALLIIITMIMVTKGVTQKQYNLASNLGKIVSIAGLSYALLARFLMLNI